MLNTPAPFPHAGSFAFLVDGELERGVSMAEPEPCRILRLHRDDTALIALNTYPGEVASGNRTVLLSALHPTRDAALTAHLASTRKRRGRAA